MPELFLLIDFEFSFSDKIGKRIHNLSVRSGYIEKHTDTSEISHLLLKQLFVYINILFLHMSQIKTVFEFINSIGFYFIDFNLTRNHFKLFRAKCWFKLDKCLSTKNCHTNHICIYCNGSKYEDPIYFCFQNWKITIFICKKNSFKFGLQLLLCYSLVSITTDWKPFILSVNFEAVTWTKSLFFIWIWRRFVLIWKRFLCQVLIHVAFAIRSFKILFLDEPINGGLKKKTNTNFYLLIKLNWEGGRFVFFLYLDHLHFRVESRFHLVNHFTNQTLMLENFTRFHNSNDGSFNHKSSFAFDTLIRRLLFGTFFGFHSNRDIKTDLWPANAINNCVLLQTKGQIMFTCLNQIDDSILTQCNFHLTQCLSLR